MSDNIEILKLVSKSLDYLEYIENEYILNLIPGTSKYIIILPYINIKPRSMEFNLNSSNLFYGKCDGEGHIIGINMMGEILYASGVCKIQLLNLERLITNQIMSIKYQISRNNNIKNNLDLSLVPNVILESDKEILIKKEIINNMSSSLPNDYSSKVVPINIQKESKTIVNLNSGEAIMKHIEKAGLDISILYNNLGKQETENILNNAEVLTNSQCLNIASIIRMPIDDLIQSRNNYQAYISDKETFEEEIKKKYEKTISDMRKKFIDKAEALKVSYDLRVENFEIWKAEINAQNQRKTDSSADKLITNLITDISADRIHLKNDLIDALLLVKNALIHDEIDKNNKVILIEDNNNLKSLNYDDRISLIKNLVISRAINILQFISFIIMMLAYLHK
jgi:hypothetical protein